MTSTGAVAGVAFLAYLEHPLAPRPRPGQIVVLDRLGVHRKPEVREAIEARGASRCCCLGTARTSTPHRVGFQQDRGVRESCGGEDEGERWTLRSRLRWGRCRWGMWWVGLSMPESRITHCENRCRSGGGGGWGGGGGGGGGSNGPSSAATSRTSSGSLVLPAWTERCGKGISIPASSNASLDLPVDLVAKLQKVLALDPYAQQVVDRRFAEAPGDQQRLRFLET